VVLVGIVVHRLHRPGSAGNSGLGVAIGVADKCGLRGIETFLKPFRDGRARHLGIVAFVPNDRQGIQRGFGVPPGVGNDGNGVVVDRHDFPDAFHAGDLRVIEAF
jgi:hypothetical protein